jgi:hypothetical protein
MPLEKIGGFENLALLLATLSRTTPKQAKEPRVPKLSKKLVNKRNSMGVTPNNKY